MSGQSLVVDPPNDGNLKGGCAAPARGQPAAAHSVGFGYPAFAPKPDERYGDHLTTDDAAPQSGGADSPARISPAAKLLGVGLLAIPGLCTALVLWGPSIFQETFFAGFDILKAAPAPFYFGFLSIALLIPIPASLLYVTAGPLYGIGPSLIGVAAALTVNTIIVHTIGTTAIRPRLIKMIRARNLSLPTLSAPKDQIVFATLLRVTPGLPFFLQSWTIVLAGIERLPFLLLSVGIQMIYAAGFIVLGRSAFEGRVALAVGAGIFLLVAAIGARFVYKKLSAQSGESELGT